jgi:hypothetical protein
MGAGLKTDRREFLASALTATGSAVAIGMCATKLGAQGAQPGSPGSKVPALSFESLYSNSITATSLTGEAADRLAIRKLVDGWAHCADRRRAEQQAGLFTPEGVVNVYDGEPGTHQPTATIRGRAAIQAAVAVLNKYSATLHLNGQSDIVVDGNHAIGESYCVAHQLWAENGQRKLQILAIRYYDRFVRQGDRWFFLERNLVADWTDTRVSTA